MTTALGEPVTGPEQDGGGCDWETALTPYHLLADLSPDPAVADLSIDCNPAFNSDAQTEIPEANGASTSVQPPPAAQGELTVAPV